MFRIDWIMASTFPSTLSDWSIMSASASAVVRPDDPGAA